MKINCMCYGLDVFLLDYLWQLWFSGSENMKEMQKILDEGKNYPKY